MENESVFRKCSSCKKDILTGSTYYVCSVTTCRGNATNYGFCSVTCWDAHVPIERHRGDSAGAIEKKAVPETVAPKEGARRIIASTPGAKAASTEDEILVVVSKVRKYIQDRAGMNTSASVYDLLSEQIKRACDLAIDVARTEGRKTVMDRDFK